MADGFRIEITGLDAFVEAFAEVGGPKVEQLLIDANKEASARIARTARSLAPRRSGKLAATVRSAGAVRGGAVLVGSQQVGYAAAIIFGSTRKHIHPNPFPFTAMDREAETTHDLYYAKLGELLDAVGNA